ncbi:MAG TPA: L-aspartate oxidase [Gemmatimonadota bacterium]|nr:L-aspartate oxidase [Gemmatimonadota bacterium]
MSRLRIQSADLLVLGSGIAGLSFAIRCAPLGRVVILTKKEDSEASTNYAQGGIAAVIDPADSFESHVADTLAAGAGLCRREAVELLVANGPAAVRELMALGVEFTTEGRAPERLSLAREGGHSARRVVRAQDRTGREIERGLLAAAGRAGVEILEHCFVLDLWQVGGRCAGALAVDRATGEPVVFHAPVTFLATGGCGQAYRYTTNPPIATGDGVAMAYRAGARVANMEFVQFHPTALVPLGSRPFLISEAVRGEGAVLRDGDGRAFVAAVDPAGDLAPRDVVARAIDAEMRRSGSDHVWLDASSIEPGRFAERFPTILATCRERGYDPPAKPLPVAPAAHYMCGGVVTDLSARTSVPGLLAAGEVACTGVHGANRLASNSLLEAVVFAEAAAEAAREDLAGTVPDPGPPPRRGPAPTPSEAEVERLRTEVGEVLWEGAGIVRSDEGLEAAARALEELSAAVPAKALRPDAAELANLLVVGRLIVRCALLRRESRGLHFNVSHPETDPALQRDTVMIPDIHEEIPL